MPASRVCTVAGCPTIVRGTNRCQTHARPQSQHRGYDAEHRRTRRDWAARVAQGGVRCRRCNELIDPNEPFDLGHPDAECPRPRAPEHANRCNRAAAGRSAHSI